MKRVLVITLAFFIAGCNANNAQKQPVQGSNTNTAQTSQSPEKLQSVMSHTTENQAAPGGNTTVPVKTSEKTKWTQSGNPIDTKELDDAVAKAEKAQKAKPKDTAANKALSEAYFNRGVALTDARQYASAIGDYRRALKADPSNEEAKKWIDQIISIYNSINKDYPKEGEEPPPLPFTGAK